MTEAGAPPQNCQISLFLVIKKGFLEGTECFMESSEGERKGGEMLKFLQLDQKQQPIRVLPPSVFCQGL